MEKKPLTIVFSINCLTGLHPDVFCTGCSEAGKGICSRIQEMGSRGEKHISRK